MTDDDDDDLARDLALADDMAGHADAVRGMDADRAAAIIEAATIYRHARSADDSPPRLDEDTRDRGDGGGDGGLDAVDAADQAMAERIGACGRAATAVMSGVRI